MQARRPAGKLDARRRREPVAHQQQQAERRRNRVFGMGFARIYPLYVEKVERKGRTREELDEVIRWLTGYDDAGLSRAVDEREGIDLETFFAEAPELNPHATEITGVICGVRVEEIEDPLMQKIRYMDKLVDELARGKKMGSILRGSA